MPLCAGNVLFYVLWKLHGITLKSDVNTLHVNSACEYYQVYYEVLHVFLHLMVDCAGTGNMKKTYLHGSTRENSTGGNNAGEVEGHASHFQENCSHYLHSLNWFKTRYDANNKKVSLWILW